MASVVKFYKGAERPDITLIWRGTTGAILDLSGTQTFELKIGSPGREAEYTKTAGIIGAQTAPNITITFLPDELTDVPVGLHVAQLRARDTSTNQDRMMQFWLRVLDSVQ